MGPTAERTSEGHPSRRVRPAGALLRFGQSAAATGAQNLHLNAELAAPGPRSRRVQRSCFSISLGSAIVSVDLRTGPRHANRACMDPGSSHQSDPDRLRADSEPVAGESDRTVNANDRFGRSPNLPPRIAPYRGLLPLPTGGIRQHSQFGTLRDAVEYYDKSNALDSAERRPVELAKYLRSI